MSRLPQIKKTSQVRCLFSEFDPGTCTSTWVEREVNFTDGSLRKPEIGEYEKQHIEKIKERGQGLDPEFLQFLIQKYINKVLKSPVDDHPPPGPNAPKTWNEKREEHKEDTQGQGAQPGRMSRDEAEARKNRARDRSNPHGATKKKGLARSDPNFYTDWTGSESGYPDEKETQHQEPKPKEKEPGPKKKAKVIPFPKHHLTPKDILKYLKALGVKASTVLIFKAGHKASWWSNSFKLWIWHSKRHKDGRWFTGGIAKLMNMTGLSKRTVKRGLKELKDIGVIFERAHGRKGETNTIWELAKDMPHVNAEKRNPKRSKK